MLTCEKIERQREFLFDLKIDLKMVDLKILKKIQKVLDR